jgi:hypothetical protein
MIEYCDAPFWENRPVVMKAHEPVRAKKMVSTASLPKAWHAVSVVPKGAGCQAAHALRGTRFLSSEAPRLPLSQCTNPKSCICSYKHYEDRRGAPRRKEEAAGLRKSVKQGEERRSVRDRRNTD